MNLVVTIFVTSFDVFMYMLGDSLDKKFLSATVAEYASQCLRNTMHGMYRYFLAWVFNNNLSMNYLIIYILAWL